MQRERMISDYTVADADQWDNNPANALVKARRLDLHDKRHVLVASRIFVNVELRHPTYSVENLSDRNPFRL